MSGTANTLNLLTAETSIPRFDRARPNARSPHRQRLSDTRTCCFDTERSAKITNRRGENTGTAATLRSLVKAFRQQFESQRDVLSPKAVDLGELCLLHIENYKPCDQPFMRHRALDAIDAFAEATNIVLRR